MLSLKDKSRLEWLYNGTPFTDDLPTNSPEDYFYRGLYYSKNISSFKEDYVEVDFEEAIFNLRKAHSLDPKNSAPLIFMAMIYEQIDKRNKALSLIKKASENGKYFNSYLTDIGRRIWRNVRIPEDVLVAMDFISNLPTPNYIAMKRMINKTSFDAIIADQLLEKGVKSNRKREFIDFIVIEHSIGQSIYKAKKKIPPGPSQDEIRKLVQEEGNFFLRQLDTFYSDCDSSKLRRLMNWSR